MNMTLAMRRNRFKSKPKVQKDPWKWPSLRIEWRSHARRAALLTLLAGGLGALAWGLDRPVRVISMDGSFQRVSPGEIEKAIAPFSQTGFMSADLDDIQRAIETLPWVEHARIQRHWPNSLHVTVTEQTAAARWLDAGLLNMRGELFVRSAAHVPAELPRLSGPAGTQSRVAQRYLAVQGPSRRPEVRVCISIFCPPISTVIWISLSIAPRPKLALPAPRMPWSGQETVQL